MSPFQRRLRNWSIACAAIIASSLSLACRAAQPDATEAAQADARPNVLLVVIDDMGYADLSSYGGEINTPVINDLANRGMRATNFCVAPTCSPTRSMLLTGSDSHRAGMGNMHEYTGPQQQGKPGYEGHLNDRVVPIAKILRDGGYHTYMAGKWHLGEEPDQWPAAKGFERDFTLMQGGGSSWSDMGYPNPAHPNLTFSRNGELVKKLPDDHFATKAFSDFIMTCVDENKSDGKPFFAYLSYQAVHSPFALPDDWLDRYKGRYDKGYDVIRAERVERMKKMGLIDANATAFPRMPSVPAWDTLTPEEQKLSARRMELYAAMVENTDYHLGRVLNHLKAAGKLDNTIVIVMSDNGAEPTELLALAASVDPKMKQWIEENWDTRPESWGRPGSVADYGMAWAQVGSGPFRNFKHYVAEGGIRVPLIVAGPGVANGTSNASLMHVTDIVPTLLQLANLKHPSIDEPKLAPVIGKSLVPVLSGNAASVRTDEDWIGWELFGNRAIRKGDWKLLSILKEAGGTGDWQLFNLKQDPGETNDLTSSHPEKRAELLAHWDQYVKDNGVIVTGDGPFKKPKSIEGETD